MRLENLLKGLDVYELHGDGGTHIEGLSYDSRLVEKGSLFVAIKGGNFDGKDFIRDAIENGAVAVVAESVHDDRPLDSKIALVTVPDSRSALSALAVRFYPEPAK